MKTIFTTFALFLALCAAAGATAQTKSAVPAPAADTVLLSETADGDYIVRRFIVKSRGDADYSIRYQINLATLNAALNGNPQELDGLNAFVDNLVKDARKVQQTILMVGDITEIYVTSYERMLSDPYFTPEELSAIALGYTKLLEESANLLTDLKTVVNENGLSMNDKERMDIIDRCYNDMLQNRSLVQYYTNKNIGVSYLRAKKQNDLDRVMALYGSPNERYW